MADSNALCAAAQHHHAAHAAASKWEHETQTADRTASSSTLEWSSSPLRSQQCATRLQCAPYTTAGSAWLVAHHARTHLGAQHARATAGAGNHGSWQSMSVWKCMARGMYRHRMRGTPAPVLPHSTSEPASDRSLERQTPSFRFSKIVALNCPCTVEAERRAANRFPWCCWLAARARCRRLRLADANMAIGC